MFWPSSAIDSPEYNVSIVKKSPLETSEISHWLSRADLKHIENFPNGKV